MANWRENWQAAIEGHFEKLIINPETACVVTGRLIRKKWKPFPWSLTNVDRWALVYRIEVSERDCVDRRVGYFNLGIGEIHGTEAYIDELLDYYDKLIGSLGLSGNATIDIRTWKMIQNNCCPAALAAAMLEGRYE